MSTQHNTTVKPQGIGNPDRERLVALVEMAEALQDPVLAVDAAGRVIHMNRAAQRITGWTAGQGQVRRLPELFHPVEPGRAAEDLDQATGAELLDRYAGGAVLIAARGRGPHDRGAREPGADERAAAEPRRFDCRATPIHDATGALSGAVLALHDRGGASRILPAADKMLQLVMDNIPQFIFWKDTRSVFLGCNRNFARVAGLERPEEIAGKTDFDMPWRQEEAAYFREVDARVMSTNTPEYHIVEPLLQADGKQSWIETNKIPLRDEAGQVVGILGTFEDITERRELEEQLRHAQKMKAVGQLAGGIAHDFNNLLTAIACHAELALHAIAPASPAYVDLEQILLAIRHAADLTQQLLTFSRRRVVQQKLIRVNEVVLGISTMLRPLIRANAEMATLLAATGQIRMDPGELEQVVVNLVVNSSNAMPDGGTLTIETQDAMIAAGDDMPHGDVPHGTYVCIRVKDTGTGMTPEVKERIFEPFFTTKGPGEGTGLGLAIVYGIISRAGGFIHVDSEPGGGTTFDMLLPFAEAQESETTDLCHADERPRGSETVLLVEDEAAVRHLAERILSELGYTVLPASNGEQALRMADDHGLERIDLVLTDVVMPVMGGTELVERLRARRAGMRILFMSGYTGTAGVDRFLDADAEFLQKPFTLDVLTRKVREVLDA